MAEVVVPDLEQPEPVLPETSIGEPVEDGEALEAEGEETLLPEGEAIPAVNLEAAEAETPVVSPF